MGSNEPVHCVKESDELDNEGSLNGDRNPKQGIVNPVKKEVPNANGVNSQKKKKPTNGFYQFMQERRPLLEAQGKNFPGGWKDVAQALDEEWRKLPIDEKHPYNVKANNDPSVIPYEFRRTALGLSYCQVQDAAEKIRMREEKYREIATGLIDAFNPIELKIVLVQFMAYTKTQYAYIPAEVALVAFTLQDGIIDNYSTLIDPYMSPLGYAIKINNCARRFGIPSPGYSNAFQDYKQIVDTIERFVDKHTNEGFGKLVFSTRDEMKIAEGCLNWLYEQCDKPHLTLTLMPLELMVQKLSYIGVVKLSQSTDIPLAFIISKLTDKTDTTIKIFESIYDRGLNVEYTLSLDSSGTSGYESQFSSSSPDPENRLREAWAKIDPKRDRLFIFEREVEGSLELGELALDSSIACLHHMNVDDDSVQYCSLNIGNRRAFSIISVLYRNYGIQPKPGRHHPYVSHHELAEFRTEKLLLKWDKDLLKKLIFSYDGIPPQGYNKRYLDEYI